MIGVISNPKKTIQIEMPVSKVATAIEQLTLYTDKYKLFKANPIINQYTFEASEFLSMGVYVDFNYSSLTDSRTDVTIEIRRQIGSFDKSHEISLANQHISTITELISTALTSDPSLKLAEKKAKEDQRKAADSERERKIEENKRKAAEEKANNPFMYYLKQNIIIIISIAIIGGMSYLIYKIN